MNDEATPDSPPSLPELFEAHFDFVYRNLRRFGVAERDVEDVTHDVFLTVHRVLHTFDPSRPIRPWLVGIAFRVASDYRKRAFRRREVLGDEREVSGPVSDPAGDEALRDLVVKALDRVPEARRSVFIMHDLEGMTAPEIAGVLRIPVNTAYTRLRTARSEFAHAVRALKEAPR